MGRKNSASKKVSKVSNQGTSDDIVTWSGEARICSKQLKHYPAFWISDTKINAYSFVYVMSPNKKKDNVAYLQDLYENEMGEKMVSARWFNFPEETMLKKSETHPQEILMTSTEQDMSAECINGIATVLTPYHFEECLKLLPEEFTSENFLCHREDRHDCIVPFSLSELQGYDSQHFVTMLTCNEQKITEKGEGSGKPAVQPCELTKTSTDKGLVNESSKEAVDPKSVVPGPVAHLLFKVNDDIEVLSQDSGFRGCWFRCKVLRSSPMCLKVIHHDVSDADDEGKKLEEWVHQKVANPDTLGMRCPGRLRVRPFPFDDPSGARLEVGVAVDAWMHDGWWEGVIVSFRSQNEVHVYFPGENNYKIVEVKHIRISKDWVDGKWMNIEPKANILETIFSISNPIPKPPPGPDDDARRKLTNSSKAVDPKCGEELNCIKKNGGEN